LAPLANFTVWTDNKNLSILFRKKCLLPNLSMQWFKAFLNTRFFAKQSGLHCKFVCPFFWHSESIQIRYFTQMKLNLNFSWVGNNFCQLFFSFHWTQICRDDAWTSIPPASLSVFSLPIFSVSPSVCLSIFNLMFLYCLSHIVSFSIFCLSVFIICFFSVKRSTLFFSTILYFLFFLTNLTI